MTEHKIKMSLLTLYMVNNFENSLFVFHISSWNPFPVTQLTHLPCIINTMVAGDLAMNGAKASAVMVMTYLS